ncbi:MAG: hypothetical protein JSW73_02550 [Candidatus Woesearchaeota archaeon]|nr:MAG: hypothetical protein JSW73_02550 [Candidatus Woesearchaeota archaeon]
MKTLNYKVFAVLIFSFLAIQLVGIYTGSILSRTQVVEQMPTEQSIIWFATAFLIATTLLVLGLRFFKGKLFFGALFTFVIFIGSETVFEAFLPGLVAIILAALLVLIKYALPNPITHNVAVGLAVAGIGAQLGLMVPVQAILVLFVILSAYDIFAVYGSKHMVELFKGLSRRGVLLGLAIPEKKSHIKRKLKTLRPGKGSGFVMLGTGDVAFPLIFAVSALEYGITSSLLVIAGSLIGIFTVFFLLSRDRKPLPALPPIALFSVLGFLISLFLLI